MKESTLKDLTLNITDGKHGDCEGQDNSGYYFISCKDVHDGQIYYEGARQITEKDYIDTHKRTQLEPNDILITNSGTIGRMAFIKETPLVYRTTFQKSVAIVKPNPDLIYPLYLYYQLQNCVAQFINSSNGSAQKNLLLSTMRAFKIKYHSDFSIQHRIASILSAYDDLIENNQKQIKLLEEAAQRLYKEWFVDLHFPGYENVKVVDGVPEGWRKEKLVDIADIKAGGDKPEVCSNSKTKDNCIPVYANGIENDGLYGYTNKPVITHESVTISARGTVGFVFLRRTPYVPIVRLLSVIPFELSAVYLYYCLNNERFDRNGTSQQQITVPMVKNKTILVADKETIGAFVLKVTILLNKIDALKKQCELLTEARDRLLPKLMSGELEV